MARTMSDDHKAALAQGRNQGRAVRLYLETTRAEVFFHYGLAEPAALRIDLSHVFTRIRMADC